jgi:hypothetical protein
MVVRTDRFVVASNEVRSVLRAEGEHRERNKDFEPVGEATPYYTLEISLYDGGSLYVDYEQDKAARDADFETVAAVIN